MYLIEFAADNRILFEGDPELRQDLDSAMLDDWSSMLHDDGGADADSGDEDGVSWVLSGNMLIFDERPYAWVLWHAEAPRSYTFAIGWRSEADMLSNRPSRDVEDTAEARRAFYQNLEPGMRVRSSLGGDMVVLACATRGG